MNITFNKLMDYQIKSITSAEAYTVRHPVLRKGKPFESSFFDGDDLNTTFHLGIFINNTLVGVCSFFKNNHKLISDNAQYQLRGMAVLDEYQSLGLGAKVLNEGELTLKKQNITTIWCNAREKAANFYKKNGYQITGEPFDIPNIGLHYVMYKLL